MNNNIVQIGNLFPNSQNFINPQRGRIYSANGISPTLSTCQGGGLEPKVIIYYKGKISDKSVGL